MPSRVGTGTIRTGARLASPTCAFGNLHLGKANQQPAMGPAANLLGTPAGISHKCRAGLVPETRAGISPDQLKL